MGRVYPRTINQTAATAEELFTLSKKPVAEGALQISSS